MKKHAPHIPPSDNATSIAASSSKPSSSSSNSSSANANASAQTATSGDAARGSVGELAIIFLRLGATSFGGPLAHIALMEHEFVEKRGWMTRQEFLDLIGATNLIPGPNSTEMAIHIGRRRGGWPGLIVAGVCFIAPAALMMLALAALYARFGALPQAQWLLRGVAPVVVAIVAQALWKWAQTALASTHARLVALCAFVLVALGGHELAILALAAAFGLARGVALRRSKTTAASTSEASTSNDAARQAQSQNQEAQPKGRAPETRNFEARASATSMRQNAAPQNTEAHRNAAQKTLIARRDNRWSIALRFATAWLLVVLVLWPLGVPSLRGLLVSFLKIGSVLYGSGYVLLAFLQSEFVPRFLSQRQLLDAIAVGQITPGPLFTTATFIGFQIAGFWGAVVATIGIFAPSFVFVALLSLLMERLKTSPVMRAFLDSVNAASLALMLWVTMLLARSATSDFSDVTAIIVTSLSLGVLLRTRINSVWLLFAGALWGALSAWLALR